ncbi:hypothetical protein [Agromyces albus]|uniref:DNA modification methylase n=1 Tax=Agromyces albus TaxID=205332 RepID=A0A4Q2KPP1_9MICO|nr:hypothetical protein [Agromyces albus]RXZ67364.1 hypothetical protein ESP51_18170 [Agromyces albus]
MKARLAASAALALGLALGSSGCAMLTYQATTEAYTPSDGIAANIGDLDVRNVLIVSDDGVDGNLIMTVVNTGEEDVSLGLQFGDGDSETLEVEVEAGESLVLGSDDEEPLLLEGIDTEPGSFLPVYFQYGDAEGVEKLVPVLDSSLPEYSSFAP